MVANNSREGMLMPKKVKPPARRVKPVIESVTYTTSELIVLMRCSRRTIRRLTAREGFPEGEKVGREVIYNKEAVHAWLRIHKPGLLPKPVEPEKSEEDKHWDLLRRRYLLEKEEREAGIDPGNPPPKPRRPPARGARA
jgi:excisionase family DNA binding protein